MKGAVLRGIWAGVVAAVLLGPGCADGKNQGAPGAGGTGFDASAGRDGGGGAPGDAADAGGSSGARDGEADSDGTAEASAGDAGAGGNDADAGSEQCGDGKRTGTEVCDQDDLGGMTCQGLDFTAGSLGCASDCHAFEKRNCRNVVSLSAAAWRTCALFDNGSIKCWGKNTYGQLGLGDGANRGDLPGEMGDALPFIDLGKERRATALAVGQFHTCALLDNGSIKCWGWNAVGQLGLGDTANRGDEPGEMGDALPAVDLGSGRTAQAVVVGNYHSCALLDNATVKCWGNGFGVLGLGDSANHGDQPGEMGDALPPVNLGSGRSVQALTAGAAHTCALLDDRSIKCWGTNTFGRLGLGDTTGRGYQPGQMGDALPVVNLGTGRSTLSVVAGSDHSCALLDNHTLKCWGYNGDGALGLGDVADRGDQPGEMGDALPAVDLGSAGGPLAVVAGGWHECRYIGNVNVCEGPQSFGGDHTCALLEGGKVKCWGFNRYGALGLGDAEYRGDGPGEMGDALPILDFGSGRSVRALAIGYIHGCVLLDNNAVKCWGSGANGAVGLGDAAIRGDEPGEMGDSLPPVEL